MNADYARSGAMSVSLGRGCDSLRLHEFLYIIMLRRLILFSFCVVLLAGCATVPPRPIAPSFLALHRVLIDSRPYLPYSALLEFGQVKGSWDPEALVWTVTVGRHELRAAPQMTVVLVDGSPERIPVPPVLRNGGLFLPDLVWTQWIGRWIAQQPMPLPSPAVRALHTIVLDAGHGGHDPGAIGRGGLREKTVTLDVTLRLRELLEQEGFRVVMTRDKDRFISLFQRSQIANREKADLFVSIHANSSRQRSVSGFEVYALSEATNDHARALEASENATPPIEGGQAIASEMETIVWDLLYTEQRAESMELAAAICRGLRGKLPSQNRGVKTARFAVLKGSRMPAILIEVGFVSHPGEEGRLRTATYRQNLAEGIRDGILAFRDGYGKSS